MRRWMTPHFQYQPMAIVLNSVANASTGRISPSTPRILIKKRKSFERREQHCWSISCWCCLIEIEWNKKIHRNQNVLFIDCSFFEPDLQLISAFSGGTNRNLFRTTFWAHFSFLAFVWWIRLFNVGFASRIFRIVVTSFESIVRSVWNVSTRDSLRHAFIASKWLALTRQWIIDSIERVSWFSIGELFRGEFSKNKLGTSIAWVARFAIDLWLQVNLPMRTNGYSAGSVLLRILHSNAIDAIDRWNQVDWEGMRSNFWSTIV